jgi:hypothetical protein
MADHDMFDYDLDSLPGIQASETLYSWCARFHRLSGYSRARSTSQLLFGHPSIVLHHDFPGRIDHLNAMTRGMLGTASDIIIRRTQLGLFAPFLSEDAGLRLIEEMRTGSGSIVRRRLGIFRSGLGATTPLKACRQCIDEDRATTPTSWWRMEHQWLPIWICLRHGEALMRAPRHCYAPHPRDWHLPDEFSPEAWQAVELARTQFDRLQEIARWTAWIVTGGIDRFDTELLRYAYHLRAKELGWVAFDGSLRFHHLRDAFRRKYCEVEYLDEMEFLRTTVGVNGGFLGHLLREHPGTRHPKKQIFLMAFLFDEPGQMLEIYENVKHVSATDGLDGLKKLLTDTREQLTVLVASDGQSVNSASLKLGVPPSMAIRHLKLTGVEYGRRPRVLTTELQDRLKAMLITGKSRDEIASTLGIRKAFIKDYLAERPELRQAWINAHLANRKASYRAHFLRILEDYPGIPIKRIRRINGNGFEWLYRNDLEWLKIHLPGVWHRP